MFRRHLTPAAPGRGPLGTAFRTAVFVLVCTGVSTVLIGCQSAAEPEETGPVRIVLEEEALAFNALPDGCTRVEPSELPFELACELLETTETPAGPPGSIWLELGEPSDFGIEIDDVAKSHKPFYEELPEGIHLAGRMVMGPLGPARYTRGRFLGDDAVTQQQLRLFMLHPIENRLVTMVYQHPAGDDGDSRGRITQLLVLLGETEVAIPEAPADEAQPE